MLLFALFLALFWGGIWAFFLQRHPMGRFLAIKRTWITVVIGIGVDMLIALLVMSLEMWLLMLCIIIASSVGIIYRSLHNEHRLERWVLNGIKGIKQKDSSQQEAGQ